MTGNVFGYRMGAGIAGAVNREHANTTEVQNMSLTNPVLNFGDPCKIGSDGTIQPLAAGDTLAQVYGFVARPFPRANTGSYLQQGFGNTAPTPGGLCNVMRRGYMTVAIQGAAVATPGGAVFIRVAGTVPSGGHIGGLEAAADATAGNTIALPVPGTSFKGAADSKGITELAYNI